MKDAKYTVEMFDAYSWRTLDVDVADRVRIAGRTSQPELELWFEWYEGDQVWKAQVPSPEAILADVLLAAGWVRVQTSLPFVELSHPAFRCVLELLRKE